jgi:hypothetical protein
MHSDQRRRERSFYTMDPLKIAEDLGHRAPPAVPVHKPRQAHRGGFMEAVIADAKAAQLARNPNADVSGFDTALDIGEADISRLSAGCADTGWAEGDDDTWSQAVSMFNALERELLSPVVDGIHTPGAVSDQALLHFHREVSQELDRRLRSR